MSICPENQAYQVKLSILETENAIELIKTEFCNSMKKSLGLMRASSPMFFEDGNGLQDMLGGDKNAVKFKVNSGENCQIINSLTKWKRFALTKYGLPEKTGIICDMNALRISENLSHKHSYYVDQWDWELHISKADRTIDFLKSTVRKIFECFKELEEKLIVKYPSLSKKLPQDIFFITTQELEDQFPNLTPKEREHAISRKHLAVFLIGIGHKLRRSNEPHDDRTPDCDDWDLNGDILFHNPILDESLEMSSMGIRVCEDSIVKQLELKNSVDSSNLEYHKTVIAKELCYSIGGGIGQSRMCMYLLDKYHIGEVQVSVWMKKIIEDLMKKGVALL